MELERLGRAACEAAMRDGEFPAEIIGASPHVALVLTQSWCPQWGWMRSYLEELEEDEDLRVFYLEYDKEDFFNDFLAFKEDRLGNREVPYVRYYQNGVLATTSNYVMKSGFLDRLGG